MSQFCISVSDKTTQHFTVTYITDSFNETRKCAEIQNTHSTLCTWESPQSDLGLILWAGFIECPLAKCTSNTNCQVLCLANALET